MSCARIASRAIIVGVDDATVDQAKNAFLSRFAWDGGHADIWRVFDEGRVFAEIVAGLVTPWQSRGVTKVCGIESRGRRAGSGPAVWGRARRNRGHR